MNETRHHGFCTLCRSRCGAIFTVADGRLLSVAPDPGHPTGGALCNKGRAAPEILADPDRLSTPLRRTRPKSDPDPGWQPVGWDEALDAIAARLAAIREAEGARAVLFTSTTPSGSGIGDSIEWIEAFVRAYGSPHYVSSLEICNFQKDHGQAFTFGAALGAPDYAHADAIVLWGHNPARTWLVHSTAIGARKPGAQLVVVDPQREGSGRDADLWLGIRPGTDGALALGAIRHMLEGHHYDEAFVRQWTDAPLLVDRASGLKLRAADIGLPGTGFVALTAGGPVAIDTREAPDPLLRPLLRFSGRIVGRDCDTILSLLAAEAGRWTVAAVAAETGLAEADILRFLVLLATAGRVAYAHWSGLGQGDQATQTVRAISSLFALRGDVDRVGANRWLAAPRLAPFERHNGGSAIGSERLPLGPPRHGFVTMRDARDAIESGRPYPIRALMSFGSNPMASYPDGARTAGDFATLGFHVHCDVRMTAMADSADFLLPVSLPWEHAALRAGFDITEAAAGHVQLRPAIVQPPGGQRPDYAIVRALAARLGFGDPLWHGPIEGAWQRRLAPTGLDIAMLEARPQGIAVPLDHPVAAYALPDDAGGVRGFATPSRRVEFHSEQLAAIGEAAVASWRQAGAPDPTYPLLLTTAKLAVYTHSSLRHAPSLARRAPAPEVRLSPARAALAGVDAGDWCRIVTASGAIVMRADIDTDLADDVLVADHGWWDAADAGDPFGAPANVNMILRDGPIDPVSGSPALRRTACRIERDEERSRGRWAGLRAFRVSERRDHPGSIAELVLRPADGGVVPGFSPGQHVGFAVPSIGLERAYSIVSTGHAVADRIAVAIRKSGSPGGLSEHVHARLAVGDTVMLRPPAGRFRIPVRSGGPLLFAAGGIGITPFLGYLRTMIAGGHPSPPRVTLVYAMRDRAFEDELVAFAARIGTFDYRPISSGRQLASAIAEARPAPGTRAFLCGPVPFMDTARAALITAGLADHAIAEERFVAARLPLGDLADATVTLGRSGRTFPWTPADGSILAAAEAAGIVLASGCRAGQCESCALSVSAGQVLHSGADVDPGTCLTCCAVPIGDVTLAA